MKTPEEIFDECLQARGIDRIGLQDAEVYEAGLDAIKQVLSIANVRARFITQEVILLQLKDGKYQDAAGNEITTEMLMEYSHDIDGDDGILWL